MRSWLEHDGPRVLWCYTPLTYDLEHFADLVVYHCVDLLGEVPGISRTLIEKAERNLSKVGAIAAGSSEVVVAHLVDMGFPSPLSWPNVADTEQIARDSDRHTRSRSAVFAGNLSRTKVDFPLLHRVLALGWNLDLAGPIAEGGGEAMREVQELIDAGATYHGILDAPRLAALYGENAVGLIPYLLNPYTRGVNPLKTFEYLAAGLRTISTAVPAVQPLEGDVLVARDDDEFVAAVAESRLPSDVDVIRRRTVAFDHSWRRRGEDARALIDSELRRVDDAG